MESRIILDREQLVELVKNAKRKVRILGAVAFDLPYDEFQDDWSTRINEGKLHVEIICESEADLTYSSLLSADKRLSGDWRSYDIGNLIRMRNEPKIKLRDYFVSNGCKHIEPKGDIPGDRKDEEQCFSLRTCFWRIPVPVIDIDDVYYYTLSLTKFCCQERFEKITEKNVWYEEFNASSFKSESFFQP